MCISHITGSNTSVVLRDANVMEATDKSVGKWNGSGGEYKERTTIHAQWIQQASLETEGD